MKVKVLVHSPDPIFESGLFAAAKALGHEVSLWDVSVESRLGLEKDVFDLAIIHGLDDPAAIARMAVMAKRVVAVHFGYPYVNPVRWLGQGIDDIVEVPRPQSEEAVSKALAAFEQKE